MNTLLFIIMITFIAGVGGTGMGGIVGALFKKDSDRTASLLLSFAAGVMTSIVCFDLILEAIQPSTGTEQTSIFIVVAGVVFGVIVVYGLNYAIDQRTNIEVAHVEDIHHPGTHDDLDELIHSNHLMTHIQKSDKKSSLFVAGIVMAAAIALHNVPEGMTIGASYASNPVDLYTGSGLILAILIGLHNIPEGMAVVVPLINGGMAKGKSICITALSGFPTVLGAILGYWLGDISPIGLSLSLSFASGAMLYVVFGEILPQAILMYRSKLPAFSMIGGLLLGLTIIYL